MNFPSECESRAQVGLVSDVLGHAGVSDVLGHAGGWGDPRVMLGDGRHLGEGRGNPVAMGTALREKADGT